MLVFIPLTAGEYYKSVFKTKAFTTGDTGVDTSATISLKYIENLEIATASSGMDSGQVIVAIDGYIGTGWKWLCGDTITWDGSVSFNAHSKLLRGYGTNLIPGVEQIRIRNILGMGDVADSVSALFYNQYLIGR